MNRSTAGMRRMFLAISATLTLFVVYVLTNTPSVSTTNLAEISPRDNFPTSQIVVANIIPAPDLSKNLLPASAPAIKPLGKSHQVNANQASDTDDSKIQQAAYLQSQPWIITKVRAGDSLSRIFKRTGFDVRDAYKLARLEEAKQLLKIQPGQEIKLKQDGRGKFALLQYQPNIFDALTVQRLDDKFVVKVVKREPEIRLNNAKAIISQHLLGAAKKANISLNTMYNFIALFGWQIDFTMDLRAGDQFSIIYEEQYLDNEKIGDGEIIAAELVVSGSVLRAIRYQDEEGLSNYYAPDGGGIKGTFLRTPLKFGHVTSNFSRNRLHPIKRVWRAHKGVDYGAPRGTPVRATGDGTVRLAKRNEGYGKTVIIRHGGKYDTVYAHLNGYAQGIRSGARVKQGEIIGYVGSTGLATGPHLHYEFRINGIHKNPVTVALPRSAPIAEKYKSQFQKITDVWVAELEYLRRIPLAQNDVNQQPVAN